MAVANKIMDIEPWIEVAPSPIVSQEKPSCSPKLATIIEERDEDYEDDEDQD